MRTLRQLLDKRLAEYRRKNPPTITSALCPVFSERVGHWHDWDRDEKGYVCGKCGKRGIL